MNSRDSSLSRRATAGISRSSIGLISMFVISSRWQYHEKYHSHAVDAPTMLTQGTIAP
jgi:hypothetical protein